MTEREKTAQRLLSVGLETMREVVQTSFAIESLSAASPQRLQRPQELPQRRTRWDDEEEEEL